MKRIKSIAIAGLIALTSALSNAQSRPSGFAEQKTSDLITNAQTKQVIINTSTPADYLTVQTEVVKGTGTTTGKIITEVSNTGNSWVRLGTAPGVTFPADSVVFTDITGTTPRIYNLPAFPYKFLRFTVTTTGTQSTTFKTHSVFKKP